MRPATPCSRFATLSASLLFAAISVQAAIEHRVKSDDTQVFRTRLLEPPPLAALNAGELVELIHQGRSESMVKTEGNVRGWVRNVDLVAVKVAGETRHRIGEQAIKPFDWNHSETILNPPVVKVDVMDLERSFEGEVVETIDREQLEMRNDEN